MTTQAIFDLLKKYFADDILEKVTPEAGDEFITVNPSNILEIANFCRDYDDLDFERYTEYYRSINGDDRLYKLLNEINLMINDFEDIGYEIEMETDGYKKILENKVWLGITEKAKEIFSEYIILNKEK